MHPGAWTDVDHVVGGQDCLLVMFHHNHRIADVAQILQCPDQPHVVVVMQPDAGFIEDVQHPHQLRTDLGGQADALTFAPRKTPRGTARGEVTDTHIEHELDPRPDLTNDLVCNGVLPLLQLCRQFIKPHRKIHQVGGSQLGNIFSRDAEPERFFLQARAFAFGTGHLVHEAADPFHDAGRRRFRRLRIDEADDPLEI